MVLSARLVLMAVAMVEWLEMVLVLMGTMGIASWPHSLITLVAVGTTMMMAGILLMLCILSPGVTSVEV